MYKDVIIVDHITMLSRKEVNPRLMEDFLLVTKSILKRRRIVEKRKNKINKIYLNEPFDMFSKSPS